MQGFQINTDPPTCTPAIIQSVPVTLQPDALPLAAADEAALTAGCYTHTTRVPFLVPDACPLERVLELLQLTLVATYALADAMHTFRFF